MLSDEHTIEAWQARYEHARDLLLARDDDNAALRARLAEAEALIREVATLQFRDEPHRDFYNPVQIESLIEQASARLAAAPKGEQ